MIVVFEGADKTGKSTLAAELAKQTKMPLFYGPRFQKQKRMAVEYSEEIVHQFYLGVNLSAHRMMDVFDNFIMDRFFVSDYVYSILRGKESCIDKNFFQLEHKVLVVITTCSNDSQWERGFKEYSNSDPLLETQKTLFANFEKVHAPLLTNFVRFLYLNTDKMNEKECMARIKIAMNEFKKEK